MNRFSNILIIILVLAIALVACDGADGAESDKVEKQQKHYIENQPHPWFDFSFERDAFNQIYVFRNQAVNTYTVWRSDFGQVLGYCPSRGFGIPYDVQMTNPTQRTYESAVIEQAEPNGLFSSKNTSATWVLCQSPSGDDYAPVYIEDNVTVYPWPIEVDWENNRVIPIGEPNFTIDINISE